MLAGCKSNSTRIKSSSNVKNEQISKLDSLKWFMYALNNYGKILAKDSASRKVELPVVSFDIKLSTEHKRNDTVAYGFQFVKPGYNSIWIDQPLPVIGIGVYGGNKYFLDFSHILPDFARKPDSVKWYIERADESFQQYLKRYEGDVAPWLKEQLVKRKIRP